MSTRHKVLNRSWWRPQRGYSCPGSSCPPASTDRWGGRTQGCHQRFCQQRWRKRPNRLNTISVKLIISLVWRWWFDIWVKYSKCHNNYFHLSLKSCSQCSHHGDHREEMAALQWGPRLRQSQPSAQWRRGTPPKLLVPGPRWPTLS